MDSLVYYAILCSLMAGAAGALVLVAVAFVHHRTRHAGSAGDRAKDRARRQQVVRLGDTFALLCFAVSAGLAIVAVMHQARVTHVAGAARDVGVALTRLAAVESRLTRVEGQQQAVGVPEPTAGEDRIGRLERRLDAVEARTTVAAPRVPRIRAARTTAPAFPPAEPVPVVQPSHPEAPARLAPTPPPAERVATPEAATSPTPEPALTTPAREPNGGSAIVAPPGVKADMRPPIPSITEQLRRDWEDLKRTAGEGEWRETWTYLKRLFRE